MSFRRFVIWSLYLSYFFLFWGLFICTLAFLSVRQYIFISSNSEHLPVFRAPREGEARSAPVYRQGLLRTRSPSQKKMHGKGTNRLTNRLCDYQTNSAKRAELVKNGCCRKVIHLPALISGYKIYHKLYTDFCIQFSLNHRISQFCMISLKKRSARSRVNFGKLDIQ